jgi:PhzF family phenazine biosynthesis protein
MRVGRGSGGFIRAYLSRMAIPLYLVDAFTSRPFAGNPAGVCLLTAPLPDGVMQNIAMEMHQAETAFLLPEGDGWRLRWFTPEVEENLCGHATLASAHVLFETGRLASTETARFQTKSGLLTAVREGESIVLDFPATPAEEFPILETARKALSIAPLFSGKTRFDLLFEVATEAEVRALAPDLAALEEVPYRGVIVTARAVAESPYDFVSRFFAPGCGVPEDPVTGSAHCALGPYWQGRLGKADLVGYQASPRGGTVLVSCHGERVRLAGTAVTVVRGELLLPP